MQTPFREAYATDIGRKTGLDAATVTDHRFGGPTAQIDHHEGCRRRVQLPHRAGEGQRRLLGAGDDLRDGARNHRPEQLGSHREKYVTVGDITRGGRGDHADPLYPQRCHQLGVRGQCRPGAVDGLRRELPVASTP